MKASVDSSALKKCLAASKIIKPVFGDYSLTFSKEGLRLSSMDKRRYVSNFLPISYQKYEDDVEEYFLPQDRTTIMESDLDNLSFNTSEKGLNIKYSNESITKSALLKRRSNTSKRPKTQFLPELSPVAILDSHLLEDLLKSASCSALIKETLTEEDMRVNQIYFYSSDSCIYSNARFYASVVSSPSINFDLSVVSSDIPYIRNYCSRNRGDIEIKEDSSKLYFNCPSSHSWLSLSKVASEKPVFKMSNLSSPISELGVDLDIFKGALKWVTNVLDSTQRVTIELIDGKLYFKSFNNELCVIPTLNFSKNFSADFPINVFNTIFDHIVTGNCKLLYSPAEFLNTLVVIQEFESYTAYHFIRSMKSK
jgi:hypothetical protein